MNKLVKLTAVTAMVVLAWLSSPGLSGRNEIPAGVESYTSGPGHAAGTFSSGVVASRLADPLPPLGLVPPAALCIATAAEWQQ